MAPGERSAGIATDRPQFERIIREWHTRSPSWDELFEWVLANLGNTQRGPGRRPLLLSERIASNRFSPTRHAHLLNGDPLPLPTKCTFSIGAPIWDSLRVLRDVYQRLCEPETGPLGEELASAVARSFAALVCALHESNKAGS